tara:strand:+ start:36892 stop:37143 length:252 start_codon:yes stop_codon:yes gene_type:complete
MKEKRWAEMLKYASPRSILVVTCSNKLIELECPFKVEVIQSVGTLDKGSIVVVKMVKISIALITVFMINNQAYYYYHFNILID